MVAKVVRYKIRPEESGPVLEAIQTFLKEIRAHEPETHYEAIQLVDGISFIHTMRFVDEAAEEKHKSSEYTGAFVKALYPRCTEMPEFTDVKEYWKS